MPAVPTITYPPDLPVSQRRGDIAEAIRDNQVVIVAGETGSGKTTQLPKICLELGRTSIAHTQPRRIAARTIAERVAEELGSELGGLVGYQVRFTDQVSDETRIKLMTDGILLNEIHRDREVARYDTIIIDEAHERSLNIDFLLGYLRRLLPRRPDLRVIITSATIDPESFAEHFAASDGTPAPIIEVSGRTFPVEIRYRPLVADRASTADAGAHGDDLELDDAPGATPGRAPSDRSPSTPRYDGPDRDMFEGIVDALDELAAEAAGDVLVFLPGEREIRDAQEAIEAHLSRRRRAGGAAGDTEVLPLYGRLSAADQHRVFERTRSPGVRRRVVLATNVAETSLTVPGIAYVIDTGTARISRYSTRAKVQRLPIEPVSQASANQRSGRSGRTRPGIAIRLYSQRDFEARPEFTDPEILRTNLASVLLQMLSLGLGDVAQFPFLQAPDPRGVTDGVNLLLELGAIVRNEGGRDARGSDQRRGASRRRGGGRRGADAPYRLTPVGRSLARLPIDPRYGRMVVESTQHDVSREVLIIVSGLSVQDIRERPLEKRQRADELHARFRDPTSDFLSLLNLWDYLEARSDELGSSAFRRLCRDEFINMVRFREWQDVFRQLRQLASPLGLRVQKPDRRSSAASLDATVPPSGHPKGDAIHRALLAGLLSHLGIYNRITRDYRGARGTTFAIFPGSGLAKSPPDVVMVAELVETSRLFARTVAKIDPSWAEQLADQIVKRQYGEPHWEKKQGQAVANETVTLYGVPIIQGRRTGYAAVDPELARELFIRHALVEGDWDGTHHAFERRNQQLRREVAQLEERARRRDLVADDDVVFDFYDQRVPGSVVSTPTFEKWWREAREQAPDLLNLSRADLLDEQSAELERDRSDYPATWQQGDQRLKVRYRFEPGADDDGVTVIVPLPLLARLDPIGFDWQVPGFRTDLITALLRALPKSIRRNFVPAADWAAKLVEKLGDVRPHEGTPPPGPLDATLRTIMEREAGIRFDTGEFDWSRVPGHLRVRFRVLDDRGRELGAGDDLHALQEKLKRASEASLVRATSELVNAAPGSAPDTPGSPTLGTSPDRPYAQSTRGGRDEARPTGSTESRTSNVEQQDLQEWPLDEIPAHVDIGRKHGVIRAYPTLRLGPKGRIDLAVVTTAADQALEHPRAVRALLARSIPSPASYVQEHLTAKEKLALASSPYENVSRLLADITLALAADALDRRGVSAASTASAPRSRPSPAPDPSTLVRTRAEFVALRDELNARMVDDMFTQAKLVAEILSRWRDAAGALKRANHLSVLPSVTDARAQLDALVFDGFVSRTGLARLPHLSRYLRGVTHRVERMQDAVAVERAGLREIATAIEAYEQAGGTLPLAPDAPPALVRARWLLEEFRISLFAQQLGAAETVSLKRIRAALAAS
ncbi:ATP-dependent helicase [Pseudoclavibacter endophyticus]|uniref:ATP-dependent RNA helicase HrpA n=1 Tax=Pseudoclavibacter endophyticus TaxID=1778590 RepID=A0A6H9WNA2_9MICO|nr:ATP-dependent RNA helicase HrpA [Pseudoclavibacter endophyticus]KAB1649568.1 ATP-dependent RNA helicase HrpA [Pseudoclavibacter endophyticus]GGA61545.1 ATP-dependent helicase [Pseudoclavibacter endophyticus]